MENIHILKTAYIHDGALFKKRKQSSAMARGLLVCRVTSSVRN